MHIFFVFFSIAFFISNIVQLSQFFFLFHHLFEVSLVTYLISCELWIFLTPSLLTIYSNHIILEFL
jgi:hypothetical protein